MGVEVIGQQGEIDGYADTMSAFRSSHHENTRMLLNIAAGRKKDFIPPAYNPDDLDNQWPKMLFHEDNSKGVSGTKVIGASLKGIEDTGARRRQETANKADYDSHLKQGWRAEPFQKPQVAVLDPASEKAALLAKNAELEGKLLAQGDAIAKLQASIEKLLAGGDKAA